MASSGFLTFTYTVIYVRDLDETLDFYRDGLGLRIRFVHDSGRYAELDTPGVTLAFTEESLADGVLPHLPGGFRPNRADSPPPGLDLAFSARDPHAAPARAMAAGAVLVEPLTAKPWGQHVAYVRDPNEYWSRSGRRSIRRIPRCQMNPALEGAGEVCAEANPRALRARLDDVADALPFHITTRAMMGGFIGYADGAVFVSLSRGGFGVKLTGPDHAELLARAGATRQRHGDDQPPSKTYVTIPAADLDDDDYLIA